MAKCGMRCEVYSRVCGYARPVSNWNKGKQEEFKDRKPYNVPAAVRQLRQEVEQELKRSA